MIVTTHDIDIHVEGIGSVRLTATERGHGRPYLLLHGGAGPASVAGFADLLAHSEDAPAKVIAPTHPGFDATSRPEALTDIRGLARLYVALLDELDLEDVTVAGNSIGGWIAAEMGLLGSPRVTGIVLLDAVGIDVAGHPVADFFSLTLDEVVEHSYHDPDRFRIDPSAMSDARRELMAGNRATLAVYGGTPSMADPTLRGRLGGTVIPVLVLWGEADRIVDPDYGRAYAAAIPGARFRLLTETGHVPQIETPQQLLTAIREFAVHTGA